jgi:hypothetical protein
MTTVSTDQRDAFGRKRAEDIYFPLQLAKVYHGLFEYSQERNETHFYMHIGRNFRVYIE